MKTLREELLIFAKENPSFVTEAITEVTNGEDLSDYSTEEVVNEYLGDDIVESLVNRFKFIMGDTISLRGAIGNE